jgi:hypothetical protein
MTAYYKYAKRAAFFCVKYLEKLVMELIASFKVIIQPIIIDMDWKKCYPLKE